MARRTRKPINIDKANRHAYRERERMRSRVKSAEGLSDDLAKLAVDYRLTEFNAAMAEYDNHVMRKAVEEAVMVLAAIMQLTDTNPTAAELARQGLYRVRKWLS